MGLKQLYISIFVTIFVVVLNSCGLRYGNIPTVYFPTLSNPIVEVSKDVLLNNLENCEYYHPEFKNLREQTFFDYALSNFEKQVPSYDIPTTESVYLQRQFFDYYTKEDPHFRIIPQLYTTEKKINNKNIKVLPFSVVAINDTMIVHHSFNNSLKRGDRIISVNQTDASKFLEYSYRDRYMHTPLLQMQQNFTFSNVYHISIERNNKISYVIIEGIALKEYYRKITNTPTNRICPEYLTGIFKIEEFNNNKKTVKKLASFINNLEQLGYKNLIIDLRDNPGGNGDDIEDLMSLISSKQRLYYQKELKIKLTNSNFNKYMFPKDSINKTVSLPSKYVLSEINITPTHFAKELNLYVLVSKNTSSMAACVANLIQYNKIGQIAGEPLLRNALKYGEVVEIKDGVATFFISTAEYNDFSRAYNGILQPDIHIPYNAKDFMKEDDPVLNSLLNHIRSKQGARFKRADLTKK